MRIANSAAQAHLHNQHHPPSLLLLHLCQKLFMLWPADNLLDFQSFQRQCHVIQDHFYSINATQDCAISYQKLNNLTQRTVVLWTPFLQSLALNFLTLTTNQKMIVTQIDLICTNGNYFTIATPSSL